MRILLAGIVAGIVVFVAGAITHMATPLGMVGLESLPREDAVIGVMKQSIPSSGLYFFHGMEQEDATLTKEQKAEAERAWTEKYRQGPNGLLVYQAQGSEPFTPAQLVGEVSTNIIGALIAAFLLSTSAIAGFWGRVQFVTLLGVFASVAIDLSYWNWYRFPIDYTVAQLVDHTIGWFFGGLVLARMVRRG
jgi:hypothetical protein